MTLNKRSLLLAIGALVAQAGLAQPPPEDNWCNLLQPLPQRIAELRPIPADPPGTGDELNLGQRIAELQQQGGSALVVLFIADTESPSLLALHQAQPQTTLATAPQQIPADANRVMYLGGRQDRTENLVTPQYVDLGPAPSRYKRSIRY